jgi:hypothetical protein
MDTSTISIKVKGIDAINALTGKGQLLSGMKLKGIATSQGIVWKAAEFEVAKVGAASGMAGAAEVETTALATKKGLVLKSIECEGGTLCPLVTNAGAPSAASGSVAGAAKASGAKGATVVKASAGAAAKTGAAASAKGGACAASSGLCAKTVGLGLGGAAPYLIGGAVVLAGAALYMYLRSRRLLEEAEDIGDLEPSAEAEADPLEL